jgi:hypothetical protein
MALYTADIEANGLDADRIWCFHVTEFDQATMKPLRSFKYKDEDAMRKALDDSSDTFIMHYGAFYDFPTLERILGLKIRARLIDSLALSWYLEPKRKLHGLATYGEDFGIPKPVVLDGEWYGPGDDATPEEWFEFRKKMDNRCSEDVRIQSRLWQQQWKHLLLLYGNPEGCLHAAKHLTFKFRCAQLQEKALWKLDVPKCQEMQKFFLAKHAECTTHLAVNMPQVPVYASRKPPAKPFKKNGDHSASGLKWIALVEEHFPDRYQDHLKHKEVIKVQTGWADPNAASSQQLKKWLFSLGWIPETFDFKRNKDDNSVRKIPQVKQGKSGKNPGELCPSIEIMIKDHPELVWLRDMTIVKHRSGILNGFLTTVDENGFVQALIQGFTNTLRFKHKICLNLPSLRKPYGKEIRGLLQARSDLYELCGSDMASLEDRTKQHFMWNHDPEYVKTMMLPGFDPHLDIAVEAGMMSAVEAQWYKDNKDISHEPGSAEYLEKARLALLRHGGKSCNYAATYGAGGATIARAAGLPEKDGDILHQAYWSRNWAVKAIADECLIKKSRGLSWLYNPVAEMWIWLKNEKDAFSTLNQSAGTYCFDRWVYYILSKRPQLTAQFHDEVILEVEVGRQEPLTRLLKWAVGQVNEELKLNRDLDCDVDFGRDYSEIH